MYSDEHFSYLYIRQRAATKFTSKEISIYLCLSFVQCHVFANYMNSKTTFVTP